MMKVHVNDVSMKCQSTPSSFFPGFVYKKIHTALKFMFINAKKGAYSYKILKEAHKVKILI